MYLTPNMCRKYSGILWSSVSKVLDISRITNLLQLLVLKVEVITLITFSSAVSVECPRRKQFFWEEDYWRLNRRIVLRDTYFQNVS